MQNHPVVTFWYIFEQKHTIKGKSLKSCQPVKEPFTFSSKHAKKKSLDLHFPSKKHPAKKQTAVFSNDPP